MLIFDKPSDDALPIDLVSKEKNVEFLESCDEATRQWARLAKFEGKTNQFFYAPDTDGNPAGVFVGSGSEISIDTLGYMSQRLESGSFYLRNAPENHIYELTLGWGMGAYTFDKYMKTPLSEKRAKLYVDPTYNHIADELDSINLARDLINTGAGDLLPDQMEEAVTNVSTEYGANLEVTRGDDLLERGFRTIHAVGRASVSAPRLMDMTWGSESDPKITILGKGVCFDSGGLDIKSAAGMRDMKKDMGGSAMALGLARLIMARKLKVRLRLLIPAVENAIAGNAYRPGDVIKTYKGTTVEIGNTDAEGRLILCDALKLAADDKPELMIDFATLTGAARVALGPDVGAMFCNNDEMANGMIKHSKSTGEPIWRLPLHDGYRKALKSKVADLSNIGNISMGGAITAALFLEHFVEDTPWAHFDVMASNTSAKPAHPQGGEGSLLRVPFGYLHERYGT